MSMYFSYIIYATALLPISPTALVRLFLLLWPITCVFTIYLLVCTKPAINVGRTCCCSRCLAYAKNVSERQALGIWMRKIAVPVQMQSECRTLRAGYPSDWQENTGRVEKLHDESWKAFNPLPVEYKALIANICSEVLWWAATDRTFSPQYTVLLGDEERISCKGFYRGTRSDQNMQH